MKPTFLPFVDLRGGCGSEVGDEWPKDPLRELPDGSRRSRRGDVCFAQPSFVNGNWSLFFPQSGIWHTVTDAEMADRSRFAPIMDNGSQIVCGLRDYDAVVKALRPVPSSSDPFEDLANLADRTLRDAVLKLAKKAVAACTKTYAVVVDHDRQGGQRSDPANDDSVVVPSRRLPDGSRRTQYGDLGLQEHPALPGNVHSCLFPHSDVLVLLSPEEMDNAGVQRIPAVDGDPLRVSEQRAMAFAEATRFFSKACAVLNGDEAAAVDLSWLVEQWNVACRRWLSKNSLKEEQ